MAIWSNKDKLHAIQREYDSAMVSYTASKVVTAASIIGVVASFLFMKSEAVMFVFVTIGATLYLFHCRDKLKKAEYIMDDACMSLFCKRYKQSSTDLANHICKL